jgi:hypothetical protein
VKVLEQRLRQRFDHTPVEPLISPIIDLLRDLQTEGGVEGAIAGLLQRADLCASLMPSKFGNRFWFDASLLQATVRELACESIALPRSIVPCLEQEWGYLPFVLFGEEKRGAHIVEFIFIRQGQDEDDINLLDYPFLHHEIAHAILRRFGKPFEEAFSKALANDINRRRRHVIADGQTVRRRVESRIENLKRYWEPTADHQNWAYELAADLLAFWTSGPAYLSAFLDVVERGVNPYYLGASHPPYAIRAQGLVAAARKLGWEAEGSNLRQLLTRWPESNWSTELNNRYADVAVSSLVEACVEAALEMCANLGLRQCTRNDLNQALKKLASGVEPLLGTELLVTAWAKQQQDRDAYSNWEEKTVACLVAALKQ